MPSHAMDAPGVNCRRSITGTMPTRMTQAIVK